jgi:hypothetical protein
MQRRLTVKLRGRAPKPDGAEGAQSLSARGAQPEAHHGPLQRLLGGSTNKLTRANPALEMCFSSQKRRIAPKTDP